MAIKEENEITIKVISSKDELIKKYNITKPNLNRILNLSRWNKKEAIPENYNIFIFK